MTDAARRIRFSLRSDRLAGQSSDLRCWSGIGVVIVSLRNRRRHLNSTLGYVPDRHISTADTAELARLFCECLPYRCEGGYKRAGSPDQRLLFAARHGRSVSMADVGMIGSVSECKASCVAPAMRGWSTAVACLSRLWRTVLPRICHAWPVYRESRRGPPTRWPGEHPMTERAPPQVTSVRVRNYRALQDVALVRCVPASPSVPSSSKRSRRTRPRGVEAKLHHRRPTAVDRPVRMDRRAVRPPLAHRARKPREVLESHVHPRASR